MKTSEIERLKESWGDKKCPHPYFSQERLDDIGAGTGDYACTQCGYTLYETDYIEFKRKREKEKADK